MKNIFNLKSVLFCLFILTLNACCKDDLNNSVDNRLNYLVDRTTRFESPTNYTNTDFIYDQNNLLIKKIQTGKFVQNNQIRNLEYIDEFEYLNGLVSKIYIKDLTFFMFSYNIHLFYNSQKNIIRKETWKNGVIIGHQNYHYQNNKVVSFYTDQTGPFETNRIYYDNLGNVFKLIYILAKTDDIGNPILGEFIEQTLLFEYDDKSKPNIGLDYLLFYSPLESIGTAETGLVRELSKNNLTKNVNSGTTWTYKYNELGLPTQYEMKWDGIQTLQPILWEITYKKVQ